jgi:hypothetical protein
MLVETDSLTGAMLELGTRGVMVTESRVWADSALNISKDIAAQLRIGKTFPDALQSARAELMKANEAKLILPSS